MCVKISYRCVHSQANESSYLHALPSAPCVRTSAPLPTPSPGLPRHFLPPANITAHGRPVFNGVRATTDAERTCPRVQDRPCGRSKGDARKVEAARADKVDATCAALRVEIKQHAEEARARHDRQTADLERAHHEAVADLSKLTIQAHRLSYWILCNPNLRLLP